MTVKSFLISILREINSRNINSVVDTFSKGMAEFSESMDKITSELGESKSHSKQHNDANVNKLLGEKKPLW